MSSKTGQPSQNSQIQVNIHSLKSRQFIADENNAKSPQENSVSLKTDKLSRNSQIQVNVLEQNQLATFKLKKSMVAK